MFQTTIIRLLKLFKMFTAMKNIYKLSKKWETKLVRERFTEISGMLMLV